MGDPRKTCPVKCPRINLNIGSPKLQGEGPKKAKIMLVGESPGQDDDLTGRPFVGSSGKLLNEIFLELNIDREDIYITHAVKCATPVDNQKPGKTEVNACRECLYAEIKKIKPNVIGCLGAIALDAVLRRTGITKLQNNVFYSEELDTKIVPVLHPAYILRNPGAYSSLQKGLKLIQRESKKKEKVTVATTKTKHIDASTPAKIDKVLAQLEKVSAFAFDLETTSLHPSEAKIILIALSWKIGLGVTVKWDALSTAQQAKLQNIFLSKKEKAGHNLKFDVQVLWANKVRIRGPFFDTLPAIALINENLKEKTLDALTLRYLDLGEYWKPLDIFKAKYLKEHKMKKEDFRYNMIPYHILCTYAQGDGDAAFRLYVLFKRELIRQGLFEFYTKYTLSTLHNLMQVEFRGIKVRRKKLAKIIVDYKKKVAESEKAIAENTAVQKYEKIRFSRVSKTVEEKWKNSKLLRSRFPEVQDYLKKSIKDKSWKFNPGSPLQLSELLFDMLKLPVLKYTPKKKPCTDEGVLTILADQHKIEIAQKIIANRKLTKFLSTYLESVYNKSAFDGRIHPNYMQHRAVTGRLACKDPNFQNIPREAKEFKKCFVADPGMLIVKADLAQAEFRCWAHYSNDQQMISDIESGMDIHRKIAAEVFNIPEDQVTDDQRTAAKNCVAGDTWIPTSQGFRKICELREGDVVLDQFNREQTILETMSKEDNLYLVETESGSVTCTKDHPFYVINSDAKLVTKPLHELSAEDYLLACTPENRQTEYVTWKYTGPKVTSFKPVFSSWVLTPDIGYLLGFITAEGSISSQLHNVSVRWTQKGKFVSQIDKLSNKIFGNRIKKRIDPRTEVTEWAMHSKEFVEFLLYTGMCADNKKGFKSFPDKIMASPPDVQKAFLQGYFLGDGTFKNHIACAGTVSKELCHGLCLLLRNFGIYPKIFVEHPKGGCDFYNIHISTKEELRILIESIEVKVPKNWSYPEQNNGKKFLHNINNFYQTKHPNCDVRYHTKLRKHITHAFLKKNCLGVNPEMDKLIEHGIYSVRINSITKLGRDKVYDFVTTGDKTMVANSLFSLDCVFGLMYGRGSKAIAEQYGISIEDAEEVRNLFFKNYPTAAIWLDKQVAYAEEHQHVKTWMGRVRRLPEIVSDDHMIRAEAERQAKNCVDFKTEVLTKRGWISGWKLSLEDYILTKNAKSGLLEWQKPTKINLYGDYHGPIVHINSKSFSAATTPDHRWLVFNRSTGKDTCKTSKAISKHGDHRIHRTGTYAKDATEIHSDALISLIGWIIADGSFLTSKYTGDAIQIGQSYRANKPKVEKIAKLLNKLSIKYSRYDHKKTCCTHFKFSGPIASFIRSTIPNKQLTSNFLLSLSHHQLHLLFDALLNGDGHTDKFNKTSFYTADEKEADMFQFLCVLLGKASSKRFDNLTEAVQRNALKSSKMHNIPARSHRWTVTVLNRDKVQVIAKQYKVLKEHRGVWCPTVPNSYFVTRRLGFVYVTGNSPIQGLASDMNNHFMFMNLKLAKKKKLTCYPFGTIHDANLIQVKEADAKTLIKIMKTVVAKAFPDFRCKMVLDFEVGKTLGTLEKV